MREHAYIEGQSPEQGTYLPESLDAIIAPENLIRLIRLFVEQLDLAYAQRQLELVEEYLKDLDEADKIDQGRLDKVFALDIDQKNLPDPAGIKAWIQKHENAIRR